MVNLTKASPTRLTPLVSRAEDILGRRYGRKNIQDKDVPFLELTPLSLKNIVSNQKTRGQEKACMDQMIGLLQCMSKFDQNEAMCGKEIQTFKQCFQTFKTQQAKSKAIRDSGELPLGPRAKLTGPQMTEYLKKFPQSSRKGEYNNDAVFANDHRTKR